MNSFINNLKENTNYNYTENGALTHTSTLNKVYDLFALGGSYRKRIDEDCILLFKKAYDENPKLALKCLFYLRDIRGGQGERRFFRICLKWLAKENSNFVIANIHNIPEYGRWDDLLYLIGCGTKIQEEVIKLIIEQLNKDIESYQKSENEGISLLAKWLPSENASSEKTKEYGNIIRTALGLSHKNYRQMLSKLRKRINIVESLMSSGQWDKIEFDKIPSKAGLRYRNAFARHEYKRYKEFIDNKETKVNAKTLYPYDVAHQIFSKQYKYYKTNEIDRQTMQKYWDNLIDIYEGKEENGLAIVDTSGSMRGDPIENALSLGAYIAERGKGPFANHFITFSSKPELIEFNGIDIVDKLYRARGANWEMNTDIKAVFDLLLKIAKDNRTLPEDMPTRLYILSDMEFDGCMTMPGQSVSDYYWGYRTKTTKDKILTLLEEIAEDWIREGYMLPEIVFWNLNARQDNIPALVGGKFTYISGSSPIMIKSILSGKSGIELMMDKLESERYNAVVVD